MRHRHHAHAFAAFGRRRADFTGDATAFVERITAIVDDVVDAAMDGVIEAIEAVPFTIDDLKEEWRDARECFRGFRWEDWRDDDAPPEAAS